MKYDFIEIGTSNFDTLIQMADDNTVGLSIEPIKYYLDCLPERANVRKLNIAVSRHNMYGKMTVHYVPESVIVENGLPDWLRGCNAVGAYHFQHEKLDIKHLVQKDLVDIIPIAEVFDRYDVSELNYLKIDTEGSDCDIMKNLAVFLKNEPTTRYPKRILFESNELAVPTDVEIVKIRFVELGYKIVQEDYDTILEY